MPGFQFQPGVTDRRGGTRRDLRERFIEEREIYAGKERDLERKKRKDPEGRKDRRGYYRGERDSGDQRLGGRNRHGRKAERAFLRVGSRLQKAGGERNESFFIQRERKPERKRFTRVIRDTMRAQG